MLLTLALLIALVGTKSLLISELYGNLRKFLAPHWALPLVLTIIVVDYFPRLVAGAD